MLGSSLRPTFMVLNMMRILTTPPVWSAASVQDIRYVKTMLFDPHHAKHISMFMHQQLPLHAPQFCKSMHAVHLDYHPDYRSAADSCMYVKSCHVHLQKLSHKQSALRDSLCEKLCGILQLNTADSGYRIQVGSSVSATSTKKTRFAASGVVCLASIECMQTFHFRCAMHSVV